MQGLRPGRPARRLRRIQPAGGRRAQPRAPAVQRQQPGPGRRLRRAGRRRVPGRRPPGQRRRHGPAGGRSGRAGPQVDSQQGQLPRRRLRHRRRADQPGPAAARGDRPSGGRLRHADLPARVHRHPGGERPLPRGARPGARPWLIAGPRPWSVAWWWSASA
ncbi:hypothetical protein OF001_U90101 [Pseudomonas sp. OF001]|nr:hypothetical protein OF001_U90101 [Pseudomonas sp. OF001]